MGPQSPAGRPREGSDRPDPTLVSAEWALSAASERTPDRRADSGPAWPRVGHIRFLNCLPLYWGLARTGGLVGLDLVADTPDRLSDALVEGSVDLGPISLVEYLRHHEDLLLLPDLAVGADGPVQSVVLVGRRPPERLDGARVAMGSTSRTSVLLARLLLEQRFGVRPRYRTRAPDLDAMLAEADAAVLIGDPALRAALGARASGLHVTDLAEAWRDWTGLPMVFAVWAVRRSYWEEAADQVRAATRAFHRSRQAVAKDVAAVARDVAAGSGLSAEVLAAYFARLDFSLGERQQAGMAAFARMVAPLVGSDPDVPFRFIPAE